MVLFYSSKVLCEVKQRAPDAICKTKTKIKSLNIESLKKCFWDTLLFAIIINFKMSAYIIGQNYYRYGNTLKPASMY